MYSLQCRVFGGWLACFMVEKWELGHGRLVAGDFFFLSFIFYVLVIYKFVFA